MAYVDLNNKLDWAMSFQRTGKFPLDRSSMFASYEDALAYARQDGSDSRQIGGTSYVGQLVVVYGPGVDGEGEEVSAYLITAVGAGATLVKLAASTASGDIEQDLIALQAKVGQIEGKVTALEEKDSPSRSEFTTLSGKIDTNTGNITSVSGRVDTLESKIEGLTGAMHFIGTSTTNPAEGTITIDSKPEYSAAAGDIVLYEKKEYIYDGAKWVEFGDEGSHLTQAQADGRYVQTTAYDLKVQELNQKDTELEGKITALEGAGYITTTSADAKYVAKEEGKSLVQDSLVTKLEGLAEIKSVNSAEFDINAESKELSVKAIEQSKVTGLVDALSAKAEKTVVDGLVTSVGNNEDPANAEGSLFARIAQLNADLTSVEENAGKIDSIKINGVALDIQEKAVDIPLATAEKLGVVKSADANDKIKVEADGTMSVNKVTTDKLVQGAEELILNGGSAAAE